MLKFLSAVTFKLKRILFFLVNRNRFFFLGSGSYLVAPYRIDGQSKITLGRNTFIQRGAWLYCDKESNTTPILEIGNDCVFGYNNHITCVKSLVIGDSVLTANNVYISDNSHGYNDIQTPIMHQPIVFKGAVSIGSGTWIGENAVIIGVSIGKNCVVAANAVVTKDIPNYCVVAGVPAKIIRRFDLLEQNWIQQ